MGKAMDDDAAVITAGQVRAARGLLGWSQEELSKAAKVGRVTLQLFEVAKAGERRPYEKTLAKIAKALERAGIEFIAENGGGHGVRMKRKGKS